ncbi:MAG: HlyD family efflux transporter periplasmic adaptor subunit [Casimicrobiaceae bacterium]
MTVDRICRKLRRCHTMRAGALALLALGGCGHTAAPDYQGYVEGEFVYVGASVAGRVDSLAVRRGDDVAAGAPLFTLESDNETAMRAQAGAELEAAQATLADLKAGKRPPEIDVTRAQLAEAQATQRKSALELARNDAQYAIGGIARAQLDDSRALHDADVARVRQIESQLKVAALPSRDEQVRAQVSQVAAAQAVVDQAAWRLRQTRVDATRAGQVQDTLYQPGEYVAAGAPVVKMLPPEDVKVRFFVPQAAIGALALGRQVTIHCDGCSAAIAATLSFVSTEAEFTPPIIYSNETRSKLVFMVEARPAPADAKRLRPGQPVSVTLP